MDKYVKKIHNVFSLEKDTNEYSYVVLKNKLTIFFIKNDTSQTGSALLYVNTGSKDNPEDTLGLAHFLEHMLFMGSEMFPGSALFQNEIKKNNAFTNAFTSETSTQYYFSSPTNFMYLLTIFSNFFIKPLFDIKYVEKEVNAVNSEHNKNISSDMWKLHNISKQFFKNKERQKFSTGTKQTLLPDNDISKLRDKLVNFYTTHYSANKMVLFVSINKTNNYDNEIIKLFEQIPIRDVKLEPYIAKYKKYKHKFELIKVKTNNDNFLTLYWHLKHTKPYNNSYHILCYILNNIDNGLQSYLEKTGYCFSSNAFIDDYFDNSCIILISIQMTDNGIDKWEYILYFVYMYIDYLLKNTDIYDIFYTEYKKMILLSANTLENIDGLSLCTGYANTYDTYKLDFSLLPIASVLIGKLNKCKKHYVKCLKNMTLQKVKAILTSPILTLKPNKQDIHYNTNYEHRKLKINSFEITNFSLPKTNPYIEYEGILPYVAINEPYKKINTNVNNIYYIQKNIFNTPAICMMINVKCNKYNIKIFIEKYLFFSYITKINEVLIDKLESAQHVFNIYNTTDGFSIIIHSHNSIHNISDLFKKYIDLFYTANTLDIEIYKNTYTQMKLRIDDYLHSGSYTMLSPEFIHMINSNRYTYDTLSKYIDAYSPENISKTFINDTIKYISSGSIISVFNGSIKINDVQSIINILERHIEYKQIKQDENINSGSTDKIIKTITNNNIHNKEYAISYGIYVGNIKEKGEWENDFLLMNMLSTYIHNHFFDLLRTEKQIGYVVSAHTLNINTTDNPHIYMVFTAQSTISELYKIIEEYIKENFLNVITAITQDEFNISIQSIETQLKEKPKNVFEDCSYMYGVIMSTPDLIYSTDLETLIKNRMNRKNILIEKLNKLTITDLINFSKKIYKNNRSVIHIIPKKMK